MTTFRSKLEQLTAALLKRAKIKYKYEHEKISYRSRVHGGTCGQCGSKAVYRNRKYLPDFTLSDGTIVEAKGRLTSSERTKFISIRASNPGIKIVFVFGADNKLNKRKESRYSDWCKEYDFEFGIKALPPSLKQT